MDFLDTTFHKFQLKINVLWYENQLVTTSTTPNLRCFQIKNILNLPLETVVLGLLTESENGKFEKNVC